MSVALLLACNIWPRGTLAISGLLFLSFVASAQDFASYQSDGMLLEATLIALFLAPRGARPGLGLRDPPSLAARGLLLFEWFRIHFESGIAKVASGDLQWRTLTAMDHYYENGPLPTWIGWWVQQLPHPFHAATAFLVLAFELVLVWMILLPRPFKIALFFLAAALQLGIAATANYTFLNYLVLALALLLLDDRAFSSVGLRTPGLEPRPTSRRRIVFAASVLGVQLYANLVLAPFVAPRLPRALLAPALLLAPFRVADRYGLFAVMTKERYEIEFQGSPDAETWIPYPFRFKPQDPAAPPGIYAPYHPRFEWNLWFASLGEWREYPWTVTVEERLMEGEGDVVSLFRADPFRGQRPRAVRAVLWQYSFTDKETKRATGRWWRREAKGLYAPWLRRGGDGEIEAIEGGVLGDVGID
jgi:hypothetical protein